MVRMFAFHRSVGLHVFNPLSRGKPLTHKFGILKLETLLSRVLRKKRHLEPFTAVDVAHECDGQTDGVQTLS